MVVKRRLSGLGEADHGEKPKPLSEAEAREYLKRHRLREVFEDMVAQIVIYHPDEPLLFALNLIEDALHKERTQALQTVAAETEEPALASSLSNAPPLDPLFDSPSHSLEKSDGPGGGALPSLAADAADTEDQKAQDDDDGAAAGSAGDAASADGGDDEVDDSAFVAALAATQLQAVIRGNNAREELAKEFERGESSDDAEEEPAAAAKPGAGIPSYEASPDAYKILVENTTGKLVKMTLKPGEQDEPHDHQTHYMYVIKGGDVFITSDTEPKGKKTLPSGAAVKMPPGPHQVKNVGEGDIEILMVEDSGEHGPSPKGHVSPTKTDPDCYEILFEDDDWFIGRMTMKAGTQDHPHSHRHHLIYTVKGDQLTIFPGEGADMAIGGDKKMAVDIKPGMAFPAPDGFHYVANSGKQDCELIFWEPKVKAEEAAEPSCCPPGGWPALEAEDTYQQRGAERSVDAGWESEDQLDLYEVGDADSSMAVVLIYDVFGFQGGRVRGVCDTLSELLGGARVILADIFGGARSIAHFGGFEAPEGQAFLKEAGDWNTRAKFAMEACVSELKKGNADVKIGAYGFCYGAYPMMLACANEMGFSAGASAHPSFAVAGLFGDNLSETAKVVKTPILLQPAGNDEDILKPDGEVIGLIKNEAEQEVVSTLYPDMVHGWIPRGDLSDAAVKRDIEAALQEGADFFKKHLA